MCFDSIEWDNQLDLDPEFYMKNHTTKQRAEHSRAIISNLFKLDEAYDIWYYYKKD